MCYSAGPSTSTFRSAVRRPLSLLRQFHYQLRLDFRSAQRPSYPKASVLDNFHTRPDRSCEFFKVQRGSNPLPSPWKGDALPNELCATHQDVPVQSIPPVLPAEIRHASKTFTLRVTRMSFRTLSPQPYSGRLPSTHRTNVKLSFAESNPTPQIVNHPSSTVLRERVELAAQDVYEAPVLPRPRLYSHSGF